MFKFHLQKINAYYIVNILYMCLENLWFLILFQGSTELKRTIFFKKKICLRSLSWDIDHILPRGSWTCDPAWLDGKSKFSVPMSPSLHICDWGRVCLTTMIVGCPVIWKRALSKGPEQHNVWQAARTPWGLVTILLFSKIEITVYVS